MDDFGILTRDFGFRPQGKSAPMSASKSSSKPASFNGGEFFVNSQTQSSSNMSSFGGYDDVFGGPPKYSIPPPNQDSPFDSLFQGLKDSAKCQSLPVYDKPVYDDDIFDGLPGLKNSGSVKYEDVFSMGSAPSNASGFDNLLGNLGRAEPEAKKEQPGGQRSERDVAGFDDLIPGFGGSSPPSSRQSSEPDRPPHSTVHSSKSSSNVLDDAFLSSQPSHSSVHSSKSRSTVLDDPFVVLESASPPAYSSSGLFTDPLERINKPSNSGSMKADGSSVSGAFDDINAFDGLSKSEPLFSTDVNKNEKTTSPLKERRNLSPICTMAGNGSTEKASMNNFENAVHKKSSDEYRESNQTLFDMPTGSSNSHKTTGKGGFRSKDVNANVSEPSSRDMSPKSDRNLETSEDLWLTVHEIPLFTKPTSAPPPYRPPPPLNSKRGFGPKLDKGSTGLNMKRKPGYTESVKNYGVSSIDELEDFSMSMPQNYADEHADAISSEEEIENSAAAASAAAMKEAMDKAEAKFKHAREVRERERDAKLFKCKESTQQEDERARKEAQETENRERQERLDREREQRQREEKEKEQKRLEKERERERIERGKARQAVERATMEARERAATEARLRAERAAVEKANAEARERAGRAAVQRAAAEARERAAAEARERAEKAAAEARQRVAAEKAAAEARERAAIERAGAELRLRAERAAVERAAAEARERAAAEARERAAAAARDKQQKNENDLESFFSMGARPNSAPTQRAATPDPFDAHFQNKGASDVPRRTFAGTFSTMRKASSTTNIVDDLASMFGAATSTEEFQEMDGETEERRRARLERHQRTLGRAKKALAEKNERDMQTQREQAERHRIAETLDIEIKRWAAGKEGNLRALLSTLQYVLWPECGWQPVSLTDLITAAAVKKIYRKATLCIHPDKVQQKGANLQQKCIAEKVFDVLKEAWNKFNSEELF